MYKIMFMLMLLPLYLLIFLWIFFYAWKMSCIQYVYLLYNFIVIIIHKLLYTL